MVFVVCSAGKKLPLLIIIVFLGSKLYQLIAHVVQVNKTVSICISLAIDIDGECLLQYSVCLFPCWTNNTYCLNNDHYCNNNQDTVSLLCNVSTGGESSL